jgi:hypothetical protein
MPGTFVAFIIIVLILVLGVWLTLSRGFEKLGNFIYNKVLSPFGFGDKEEPKENQKEKKEEGDK